MLRPAWGPGLVGVVPEEARAIYSEGCKDALLGSRVPKPGAQNNIIHSFIKRGPLALLVLTPRKKPETQALT